MALVRRTVDERTSCVGKSDFFCAILSVCNFLDGAVRRLDERDLTMESPKSQFSHVHLLFLNSRARAHEMRCTLPRAYIGSWICQEVRLSRDVYHPW